MTPFVRALSILGLAIPVVVGLIQIVEWFVAPRTRLSAHLEFNELTYHPGIIGLHRELYRRLSAEVFLQAISSKGGYGIDASAEAIERISQDASWVSRNVVSEYSYLEDTMRAKGHVRANITNPGDRNIEAVKLVIPDMVAYQITRLGGERALAMSTGAIEIGTMSAKEHVLVDVWIAYPRLGWRIEEVVLSHRDGVGTYTYEDRIVSDSVWYLFYKNVHYAFIGFTILVILGLVLWTEMPRSKPGLVSASDLTNQAALSSRKQAKQGNDSD